MRLTLKPKHFDLIGWVGFVLIVSAYFLLTFKQLEANSPLYHSINLLGALCMVANAKHKGSKPLLWLNLVWFMIAMMGLLQLGP